MATSRGAPIKEIFKDNGAPEGMDFVIKKGAKYMQLLNMALPQIQKALDKDPHKRVHVYFLAGMPDTTLFHHSWDRSYQEVVVSETVEEVTSRVSGIISHVNDVILAHGAQPCFCTIAPMHIETWNNKRRDQRVTTHLKFEDQYSAMQKVHEESCALLNRFIYQTNESNGMTTPATGECTFKTQSHNRPEPRLKLNRYEDGVHLLSDWSTAVADQLLDATLKNWYRY